jgi:serine/threonine-protein kinase RsbW
MQNHCILELPSDLQAIERAVEELVARSREAGFVCEQRRLNLQVGVTEALANAMLYGNARDPRKRVRIEARITADSITINVTDEGRGFDPAAVPDPTLPANLLRAGGRGLFLIRQLMDRVEFNECGNSITMVLHRERPDRHLERRGA